MKTGHIRDVGYTLAFAAERNGHRYIGVILGETNSSRRFQTAQALPDWADSQPPTAAAMPGPGHLPAWSSSTCPPVQR
ncbi:hypothetical protein GCM10018965_050740 [Nonomuraea roseola]